MSDASPIGWLGGLDAIAEYAGVSRRTVGRWINEGRLKVRHLSARKVLCKPADVDRCIFAVSDAYSGGGK